MTKKVDVSTSPLPLTSTITATIAKNNNNGTVSHGTSLHSQFDSRVHQQAVCIPLGGCVASLLSAKPPFQSVLLKFWN